MSPLSVIIVFLPGYGAFRVDEIVVKVHDVEKDNIFYWWH
jgi:hypothetical protein